MRSGLFLTRARAKALCLLGATLLGWQGGVAAHEIFYMGRAIGVVGTITAGSTTADVVLGDTLPMSCSGRARDATVATVNNPTPLGVRAQAVSAHTVGMNSTASSDAGLQDLVLDLPGVRVTASSLQSNAEATCNADGSVTLSGDSNVTDLKINGQGVRVSGAVGQRVGIEGVGTLIINQHLKSDSEIKVNAIRVVLANESYPAHGTVLVAHSKAGMNCKP